MGNVVTSAQAPAVVADPNQVVQPCPCPCSRVRPRCSGSSRSSRSSSRRSTIWTDILSQVEGGEGKGDVGGDLISGQA